MQFHLLKVMLNQERGIIKIYEENIHSKRETRKGRQVGPNYQILLSQNKRMMNDKASFTWQEYVKAKFIAPILVEITNIVGNQGPIMDTNSYDLGNGAKSIVNMKQVTSNRFEIFIDEDDVSTTKVDMEVVPNTPMDIQVNGENDVQIMNGQ